MLSPYWIAAFYGISEVIISTALRSKTASASTDRGSLRMIWTVVNVSMASALLAAHYFPFARFGGMWVYWTGVGLFVFAIALRWYSIAYLGKSFTVDVAVRADQRVIDTGPYRFIRHPSYTGSLLAFVAVGLSFRNYVTLLLMIVPTCAVFLYRLRLEETALLEGLGESYKRYMGRTKRLIPGIY